MSKSRAQLFQEEALRNLERDPEKTRANNPNPMVRELGFYDDHLTGAERGDTTCESCRHCLRKEYRGYKGYRCRFRRDTNGPATDHRLWWPACTKYEPKDKAPA